jgi:hypothetical protein
MAPTSTRSLIHARHAINHAQCVPILHLNALDARIQMYSLEKLASLKKPSRVLKANTWIRQTIPAKIVIWAVLPALAQLSLTV